MDTMEIFLDSGAYSAFAKGVEIDIDAYIDFIKQFEDELIAYANLDVIGDAKATYQNQKYMEKAGLTPVPCFHYGEDPKWLQLYLNEGYVYVALGGMVPVHNRDLLPWLQDMWTTYLTGDDGMPLVKVHGFGLTSHSHMVNFPWYSVDSTAWLQVSRNGYLRVPGVRNGKPDYIRRKPITIIISEEAEERGSLGIHFRQLDMGLQRHVLGYLEEMGLSWGEVASSYKKRDEAAIYFYRKLSESVPEWPWRLPYKTAKQIALF